VSADGKVSWFEQFKASDFPGFEFPEAWYEPIFWLPNEPYVYLVGKVPWDGPIYFYSGFKLSRLNLLTGEFSVQDAGDTGNITDYSFSPGGKFLLTAGCTQEIKIIRIKDWSEKKIILPVSYTQSGDALWSADQEKVIVVSLVNQSEEDREKWQILLLDVDTASYHILVDNIRDDTQNVFSWIRVQSWISEDEFLVLDIATNLEWIVNVVTGEVSPRS
jgi:hypothetical protein